MFCKNCGAQIDDNAVVCVNCGVATTTVNANAKNKLVAALLAFFVGGLGIHNFYLGHKKKAIIQLLLTVVGSLIIIGPVIAGIWAFVDFIMILLGKIQDADGNDLV